VRETPTLPVPAVEAHLEAHGMGEVPHDVEEVGAGTRDDQQIVTHEY